MTKEEIYQKYMDIFWDGGHEEKAEDIAYRAMEEYAKQEAIEFIKWGASNRLECLLGVWCDNERTYDTPEEIYQTFTQFIENQSKNKQ